jgi:hypothetical protein
MSCRGPFLFSVVVAFPRHATDVIGTEGAMGAIFRRLEGRNGRAEIPRLGVRAATLSSWTLTRRDGAEAEFYDLHAVCSMVLSALFTDPEYGREVVVFVQLGKGQSYRLDPQPGQRMVLQGKSLLMEKVRLVREQGSQS